MQPGTRTAAVAANAAALGVSRRQLMESSGQAVARVVREEADDGASVAVVVGRGKASGIAFVAARFLREYDVSVALVGRPESIESPLARRNWDLLTDEDAAGTSDGDFTARTVDDPTAVEFDDPDLVVDGVSGATFGGDHDRLEQATLEAIDETGATTVSIDAPSGDALDGGDDSEESAGPEFADRVVTFHRPNPALESHPDVTVAEIGIPRAAERFVGPGDVQVLRGRLRGGKRDGDTGRVYVVGGGPYTGAPALCAQSALRAGADLSFVAVPDSVSDPIQGYTENLIVQPYDGEYLEPDHVDSMVETAADHDDVVVLGPGLGDESETRRAAKEFLEAFDGRAVVDADAIPVVSDVETDASLVITPNRSELAELGGPTVEDVREWAEDIESFASDLGHTLVVKSRETVVTNGERTRVSRPSATGMTVGGTGDILAGVVAAFFGVAPPFDAACAAAHVKNRAGHRLAGTSGAGFVATDLLWEIPRVIWPPQRAERSAQF